MKRGQKGRRRRTGLSALMRRKRVKVEYQVIFNFPGNKGVGGLWQRIDLIRTQRTILAFAAKLHKEYDIITLCIKAPELDISHEVYYWCKGELTTNWGTIPTR